MSREDELMDQRHQEVLTAISGVHSRLDTLNGRTRKLENQVGVLSWAYLAGGAVIAWLTAKVTGTGPQ